MKNRDNLDLLLGIYFCKYMLNIKKLYLCEILMFFVEIINMQRVKCICRNQKWFGFYSDYDVIVVYINGGLIRIY